MFASITDESEAPAGPGAKADAGEPTADDLFAGMGEVPPAQDIGASEEPSGEAELPQTQEPLHAVHPPPPEPEEKEPEPESEEKQPDVSAIADAVLKKVKGELGQIVDSAVQNLRAEVEQLKGQLGGLATKDDVDQANDLLATAFDGEIRGILSMEKMPEDTEAATVFPQRVRQLAKTALGEDLKPVKQDVEALVKDVAEAEAYLVAHHNALETVAGPFVEDESAKTSAEKIAGGKFEGDGGLGEIRTEATIRLLVQALASKNQKTVSTRVVKMTEKYGKETITQLLNEFVQDPQIVVRELARLQGVKPEQLDNPQNPRIVEVRKQVETATPVILENAKALIGGSA
jgi:hypothetical protein